MARLGEGVFRRWHGLTEPLRLRRMSRQAAAEVTRLATTADTGQAANIPHPLHTDWAWRPDAWAVAFDQQGALRVANGTRVGRDAKVFSDCRKADASVRQIRARDGAGAPWALAILLDGFEGSFLSVALDLPAGALRGLSRDHLVRISVETEGAEAGAVYARLNLRHGPNVAQIVRKIEDEGHVDLDLAVCDLDDERLESGWVDLIFEAPLGERIVLEDVTLSRRPRAVL